jgi:UDP-galactopyranose mutase
VPVDYLVVGSGMTGATIARLLHDRGRRVLVVERRGHLGGNVHDWDHPSGVRVHTYGPHYFRTNSATIWSFVTRFAAFYHYEAEIQSLVDGEYAPWPVSRAAIARLAGDRWEPAFTGEPANFEEAALTIMPRAVYERFVRGYTEKQWGVPARQLAVSLARRLEVREDDDRRLSRHRYQGLVVEGYAALMRNMLAGIPTIMNCDYLREPAAFADARYVVYTGPIDEFFGWRLGKLAYRAQRRSYEYLPDTDYVQPCAQVNNPDPAAGRHVRTIEWKHLMPRAHACQTRGTIITRETPVTPSDPGQYEYPFPDAANEGLYQQYRAWADALPNTLICGRLGEYRYFDMDQAIGRATQLARRLLEPEAAGVSSGRLLSVDVS